MIEIKFSKADDENIMNVELGIRQRISLLSTGEMCRGRMVSEEFYNQIDLTRNLELLIAKIGPFRGLNLDGLRYSFLMYINLKKILSIWIFTIYNELVTIKNLCIFLICSVTMNMLNLKFHLQNSKNLFTNFKYINPNIWGEINLREGLISHNTMSQR